MMGWDAIETFYNTVMGYLKENQRETISNWLLVYFAHAQTYLNTLFPADNLLSVF